MINDIKDNKSKTSVDLIWKKFMTLPDKQIIQKGTEDPYLENKAQLVAIIEELEKDNLVMFTS
jgi:hypothetical protein